MSMVHSVEMTQRLLITNYDEEIFITYINYLFYQIFYSHNQNILRGCRFL